MIAAWIDYGCDLSLDEGRGAIAGHQRWDAQSTGDHVADERAPGIQALLVAPSVG